VLAALLCTAIAQALGSSPPGEATRLRSEVERASEAASRRLRPPAERLGRDLPLEAGRLDRLSGPAATVEGQLTLALAELERMSALTYDPHYLPALVAVGRAFLAATGQDPLTRTQVNPEFAGLGVEIAAGAAGLDGDAQAASRVSRGVRSLSRARARSRHRARSLERLLERARGSEAG
jgi:hypothetical protein